jgi:calcineurin-like phosphoesterase family protein
MINQFKIKTANNKVWLTSDAHFGHAKEFLFKPRGFSSVEEHDVAVLAIINELVQPDDYLIFAGDFCLNTTLDSFKSYCARISCRNIIFCAGNHNNPWWKFYKELVKEKYGEEIEVYPFRWQNIIFVGESVDMVVDGYSFHISHFPKLIWDKSHHGRAMGCGHSHGSCLKTLPNHEAGKIVDLGWDVFGRPIELEEFKKIMDKKVILKYDHHDRDTN